MKEKESITYNDILMIWLHQKTNIKIQSLLQYENLIKNYLTNTIGYVKINNLSKEDIDNLFMYLAKKEVSLSTRKTLIYIVRSSLSYSYHQGYNEYIDLSHLKFKLPNKSILVLSKEEQIRLEKELKEKRNIRKVCLLLCLYTGLRVGEVCGLKWKDIDFQNKSITIKRTIERIKNKKEELKSKTILIESTPKSDTSNRTIPMPDFLSSLLLEWKKDDDFYLLSQSTKLYDPRLLEAFYSRILKKCEITPNKFHTLRHTFATRSIEAKMDIKTLSEILGHSKVEITLRLYVHPTYELKKLSIEQLVEFMAKK